MVNSISIIIPTLNEEENIADLIVEINKVFKRIDFDLEIIIVDDGSSDNTLKIIRNLIDQYLNLKLIARTEKGLTSAIIKGFQEAKGDIFCVMDADFSHHPKFIPDLILTLINFEADMVIASRYLEKSLIKNWSMIRRILSKIATIITRLIIKANDPLSGFFVVRKDVIANANFDSNNPKICLEILLKGNFKNKIIEIPYEFIGRTKGKSKFLSLKTLKHFSIYLFRLILVKNSTVKRFIKFIIVGGIGVIINLLIFHLLIVYLSFWYISSAVVSFFVAVTNNYFLNKKWTFADSIQASYLKFVFVSLSGLIVNIAILFLLVEYLKINYLYSQLIAIAGAGILNFYQSQRFVFKYS
jgi:dolichol-phosphate mannosyltransferase